MDILEQLPMSHNNMMQGWSFSPKPLSTIHNSLQQYNHELTLDIIEMTITSHSHIPTLFFNFDLYIFIYTIYPWTKLQNYVDNIFKCIFIDNIYIFIKLLLVFVPE